MATPSSYDFETFYHAVCGDLTNKGEVHSMSKQFSLLGDDNERIKFVLEKNFAGSVHWKDFNYTPKDRWAWGSQTASSGFDGIELLNVLGDCLD